MKLRTFSEAPRAPFLSVLLWGTVGLAACSASHGSASVRSADPLQDTRAAELFAEGKQLARSGDTLRAEQYFVAAVERGYSAKEVLPFLIDVCVKSNRLDSALSHAIPVLRRDPSNWRLRYLVATLHSALGSEQLAQIEFLRVLGEAPNAPAPHFALGRLLWDRKPNAAKPLLERYLELAPHGNHASEARALMALAATDNLNPWLEEEISGDSAEPAPRSSDSVEMPTKQPVERGQETEGPRGNSESIEREPTE